MTYASPDTELIEEELEVTAGPSLWAKVGAEAFGAFFFVLAVLGVGMYAFHTNNNLTLAVALAAGLALLGAGAAVAHISGGHFNPAVTLGVALAGRMRWIDVIPYIVAQVVGALLAGLVLFLTVPKTGLEALVKLGVYDSASTKDALLSTANGFGAHSPFAKVINSAAQVDTVTVPVSTALLMEGIATAVFVGVVLGVTSRLARVKFAPVAAGLSFAALVLVVAPFTGAGLNPVRSLASAVFGGGWAMSQLWVFLVAPLLGGAIAGLAVRAFGPQDYTEEEWLVEEESVEEEYEEAADDADVDADSPADVTGIAFGLEESPYGAGADDDAAESDGAAEAEVDGAESEAASGSDDGDGDEKNTAK